MSSEHTISRSPDRPCPGLERMGGFSDGVLAVVITLMVLDLKPPANARLEALLPLWPTAISYAVSYAFIAVVWINHHHLTRFIRRIEPQLIWLNFAHLFVVSLLPFATAWMAATRLGPAPVALYATLFVAVNLAYAAFQRAVIRQADSQAFPEHTRRAAWRRVQITVTMFAAAAALAFVAPIPAVGLICAALGFYVRPDATPAPKPRIRHALISVAA